MYLFSVGPLVKLKLKLKKEGKMRDFSGDPENEMFITWY